MERNLLFNEINAIRPNILDHMKSDHELLEQKTIDGTLFYVDLSALKLKFPDSGIFIPRNFRMEGNKVNILLYFHGLIKPLCANIPGDYVKTGMKSYLENNMFFDKICHQIAESKKNVIFIALTTMINEQKYYPKYRNNIKGEVFNSLIKNILSLLVAKDFLTPQVETGNIILAGHSAGGSPMQNIISDVNKESNGNPANLKRIKECWGFDSQYRDGASWKSWLENDSSCIYRHASVDPPKNKKWDIDKFLKENPKFKTAYPYMYISNLWYLLNSPKPFDQAQFQFIAGETSHCKMVNKFLPQFLKDTKFL